MRFSFCVSMFLIAFLPLHAQKYSESNEVKGFHYCSYRNKIVVSTDNIELIKATPEYVLQALLRVRTIEELEALFWGEKKELTHGWLRVVSKEEVQSFQINYRMEWILGERELVTFQLSIPDFSENYNTSISMIKIDNQWCCIHPQENIYFLSTINYIAKRFNSSGLNALFSNVEGNNEMVDKLKKQVFRNNGIDLSLLMKLSRYWKHNNEKEKIAFFFNKK